MKTPAYIIHSARARRLTCDAMFTQAIPRPANASAPHTNTRTHAHTRAFVFWCVNWARTRTVGIEDHFPFPSRFAFGAVAAQVARRTPATIIGWPVHARHQLGALLVAGVRIEMASSVRQRHSLIKAMRPRTCPTHPRVESTLATLHMRSPANGAAIMFMCTCIRRHTHAHTHTAGLAASQSWEHHHQTHHQYSLPLVCTRALKTQPIKPRRIRSVYIVCVYVHVNEHVITQTHTYWRARACNTLPRSRQLYALRL